MNIAENIQRVRKRSRNPSLFGVCVILLQNLAGVESATGFHLHVFSALVDTFIGDAEVSLIG